MKGKVLMIQFIKRYRMVHIIVVTVLLLTVVIGTSIFFRQIGKLRERKAENAELKIEKQEVTLRRNDLRLLSQYMDTEDYAIYYARYRLGYVYPYEIILKK